MASAGSDPRISFLYRHQCIVAKDVGHNVAKNVELSLAGKGEVRISPQERQS